MSHLYDGDPTNFPTSLTLPDDGDQRDAASVNVPFEGLADRTAFLYSNKGFDQSANSGGDDPDAWADWDTTASATYSELGGGTFRIDGDTFAAGNHLKIMVTLTAYMSPGTPAHAGILRITAGPTGGSYTPILGSRARLPNEDERHLTLQGIYTVTADGPHDVFVEWKVENTTGAPTIHAIGEALLTVVLI
jgi:hypothetical protein